MSETRKGYERVKNPHWMRGGMVRQAGKIILYMVMLGVLSLLITPLLSVESLWIRIPLNVMIFGGVWMLLYADGGSRGQHEVAHAERLAQRQHELGMAVVESDRNGCYHPMRGIAAALLSAAPFVLMGIVVAIAAQPYTYTLQDLPSWLKAYTRRPDIGGALAYYQQTAGLQVADYLRIIVRLVIMPISLLFGGFGDAGALLVDRMSPLWVILLPLAYAIGYLRGPALNVQVLARNEEAKRRHKKKLARKKKQERARAKTGAGKGPERLV